jgi:hypothetical protein
MMIYSNNGTGSNGGYISCDQSGSDLTIRVADSGTYMAFLKTATWSINTWYHIAVVRQSDQYDVYLDGQALTRPATSTKSGGLFNSTDGRIGEFFGEVSVIVLLTIGVSLIEALIILPSHVAHSKALTPNQKSYSFNKWADRFMDFMKETLYGPYLTYFMKNKLLGFAIPIAMFILTIGAIKGGIIKFTFFPQIASDRVVVTLKMPQGTHESITDSIITLIEQKTWVLNDQLAEEYDLENPIESVIKKIGPGTSVAFLYNFLPGRRGTPNTV